MSRMELIKHPEEGSDLHQVYQMILEGGGQGAEEGVPTNIVTSMGARPDLIMPILMANHAIRMEGLLPPTVKQMIAMTIAVQHNCRYCAVGIRSALEAMGVSPEVIESCASDPELSAVPPTQRAIIKFALKADRSPKTVLAAQSNGDWWGGSW